MSSSRSLRREIARKKQAYLKRLDNCNIQTVINCASEDSVGASSTSIPFGNAEGNEIVPPKEDLCKKLKNIFLKHHVSRRVSDDILHALNEDGINVPKTTKQLLNINNDPIVTRTVNPGLYFHFGLKKQVLKLGDMLSDIEIIEVDIGIDGLPLFKSSLIGLWPILGKIINLTVECVFPIGIYCGNKKPLCINSFLHDLINDLKDLFSNGILYKNRVIQFKIRAFICDAPARAFVTGCVGHNAFHGCSRCLQIGRRENRVTVYSNESGQLRTNESFKNRTHPEHHSPMFRNTATDLENIGIQMVSQFPIDPMHLFDLGVMRKILNLLVQKMNSTDKEILSNKLLSIIGYIPQEFGRKPRTLDELRRWKAIEFGQFILYSGIVVLKDIISDDVYYHFLLIHCAYRLLCCPYSYKNNINAAESLLQDFVKFFENIYGIQNLTYNVHNLLHICECVRELGLLTNFSAYSFENYMQSLKKSVKKPHQILEQLKNRYENKTIIIEEHSFRCSKKKGKCIQFNGTNCYISYCVPNNFILLKPDISESIGTVVKITRIAANKVYGVAMTNLKPYFNMPVPSIELGIALIDNLDTDAVEFEVNINAIKCKMVCLPYNDQYVVIPVLHNCV